MRRTLLLALTVVAAGAPAVSASTGQVYGAGSFMWPSSPGKGHLGLYIDDDISHTRLMSTLRNASGQLCSTPSDGKCGGSDVSVYAVLPVCTSSTQNDCIESVGSRTQSGSTESATFSRYFPEQGLGDFAGDPSAKIPTGAAPSIWTLPGTSHPGGDEYMAVVSVAGNSSAARKSLGNVTLHASLYPVRVVAGRFSRNIPSPVGGGVSHPSVDTWANCASLAEGYCAARQDFPAGTAFSLGLRLSTPPTGWLHGRIFSPDISFSTADGVTRLRVEATPAQVPAVATWARVDTLPSSVSTMGCTLESPGCGQLNPQSAGAHHAVTDWRTAYADKASWVRGHWMYMTLPGSVTSSCLQDTSVLHGFVTTNATGYAAGPPSYSSADNSFSYTVASPHFDQNGAVIQGTYNFVVRSATARCIYGIEEGQMSATVSISERNGGDQSSSATVSVVDDGTWLKVSASGFHYSSPVIKTVLTSTVAPTKKEVPTVATTTPSLSTKRALTSTAVARQAGIKVPSGARVRLKVSGSSSRVCRVVGTSLRGTRAGTCRVTVTVTPKGKKATSRTVSFKVV